MQHTFFVHFFAAVLYDYIEKLPETSRNFLVTCFMCSCWLFFRCRSFSPWWPLAFPPCLKFLCFSSNEIGLLCFLSRSSSFSVIHVNVDIKIKSNYKISALLLLSVSPKSEKLWDLPSKRTGAWNPNFHPGLHEGVDARTDPFLAARTSRARELRYDSSWSIVFLTANKSPQTCTQKWPSC